MMRTLAQRLGRVAGGCPSFADGTEVLQRGAALAPLEPWRSYSSSNDDESTSTSTPADAAAAKPPSSSRSIGSTARPSRLQTKEWRSWIDTKLDNTLGGSTDSPAAATAKSAAPAAKMARRSPAAASTARASPPPPSTKAGQAGRARGFQLEQQIYSIVAPSRPAEDATLPEGVTNYGQLAMASDAPRFERGAANIADISPQRIHPTRLFFPNQMYSPSELDPYKSSEAAHDFNAPPAPPINPDEVTRLADFKNAPLLAAFLSEAGQFPLRARTQLRAKLHRHLARQVKTARAMGILSPTERWRSPQDASGGSRSNFRQRR
ncbi:30S ribosomal protein S18 [Chlorella vulgaris]